MTLIVGIKCKEGIVVAADSRVTMGALGQSTTGQDITKLEIPHDGVIVGISGPVGLGQRMMASLSSSWEQFMGSKTDILKARNQIGSLMWTQIEPEMKKAAVAIQVLGQQVAMQSSVCSSLIALPIQGQPVLLQYDHQCSSEEATLGLPFASIGLGQKWADPFLAFLKRSLWNDGPPPKVSDGALAAIWTIEHVIQVIPVGGVGGSVAVATLSKHDDAWTAEFLPEELIQFHRQNIEDGVRKLAEHFEIED